MVVNVVGDLVFGIIEEQSRRLDAIAFKPARIVFEQGADRNILKRIGVFLKRRPFGGSCNPGHAMSLKPLRDLKTDRDFKRLPQRVLRKRR